MTEVSSQHGDRDRLRPDGPVEALLLFGAIAIGALWRLPGVDAAFLFGDELHTLFDLPRGHAHLLGHFSPTGAGMALPIVQRLLVDVFGSGHWVIRAPAWVPGLLLVPATWLVARRWLGGPVAIGATWLVAVCPLLVFYTRFARAYAGVVLGVLLLVDRVQAVVADGRIDGRRAAALIALIAVTPWMHPTALAAVVPVVIAGALAAAFDPRRDRRGRQRTALGLLATLAAGGLLCAIAHAPAYASLLAFVNTKTTQLYTGSFGPLDVAALVTGGRLSAVALTGLAVAGAIGLAQRCGVRALPLAGATLGPIGVIAAVRPYGDAYAYARYVIAAVPFWLVLVAYGVQWTSARLSPRLAANAHGLVVGIAVALLLVGPPGPFTTPTPQHANTYLGLRPLPAFDAPWPDTPAFYRTLAEAHRAGERSPTLVEVPALTTRTRHLYRHYQRQHRAPTLLGPLPSEFPMLPAGPYVPVWEPQHLEASGADLLVVHRDVANEVERYWRWVYAQARADGADRDAAYMARHERYGGLLPPASPRLLAHLAQRFGEPVFEDETIVVHRIRPAG